MPSVATVLLGDADGDGTVDVIDVNDVQGIIDIALGKTKAAARKMEEVEETLNPQ